MRAHPSSVFQKVANFSGGSKRTAPLIGYYTGRSRFNRIDGYRPADVVFDDLLDIVARKPAPVAGARKPA